MRTQHGMISVTPAPAVHAEAVPRAASMPRVVSPRAVSTPPMMTALLLGLLLLFTTPPALAASQWQGLWDETVTLFRNKQYPQALKKGEEALAASRSEHGAKAPNTISTLQLLANLNATAGHHKDAEKRYLEVLEILQERLGQDHPDVIKNLGDLAELYRRQERMADAITMQKRILSIREKSLGIDHIKTADARFALAELYGQNRDEGMKAAMLLETTLPVMEKSLGPRHPRVAEVLIALGRLYNSGGRYAGAGLLLERALDIRKKAFGEADPESAEVMIDLGRLYGRQRRFTQGVQILGRAIEILDKHKSRALDLANALDAKGELFLLQNRYDQVEPLFKRALAIREKRYGKKDPRLAPTLNNLVALYLITKKSQLADPIYHRLLEMARKGKGSERVRLSALLTDLAKMYWSQGHKEQSKVLFEHSTRLAEEIFHKNPWDHANWLNNQAIFFHKVGSFDQAATYFKRSKQIIESNFGGNNPQVAVIARNLEKLKKARAQHEKRHVQKAQSSKATSRKPQVKVAKHHTPAPKRVTAPEKKPADVAKPAPQKKKPADVAKPAPEKKLVVAAKPAPEKKPVAVAKPAAVAQPVPEKKTPQRLVAADSTTPVSPQQPAAVSDTQNAPASQESATGVIPAAKTLAQWPMPREKRGSFIPLACYSATTNALGLLKRSAGAGVPAYPRTVRVQGRPLICVYAGPFPEEAAAQRAIPIIRKQVGIERLSIRRY